MNSLFAFAWLVIIGSNGAEYYSKDAPYAAAIILAGGAYVLFVFHRELLRLVFFKDYLLVFSMLVVPILLMLLSERSFDRGFYTSQICYTSVFVIASVLALRADLDRARGLAAFLIVAVGVALNLYELLIENNVWSSAPGRSAGWYGNPTITGEALLGYGLAFLTDRVGKLRFVDWILMALVVVGVFATFSRAAILASLVLLPGATLMRARRGDMMRVFTWMTVVSVLVFVCASYVVHNLDLSKDATSRIQSLLEEGGVGDYEKDRGEAALKYWDLIIENPVSGAGVLTSTGTMLPLGPHNMFVAMMLDYGIFGLIVYLVLIIRLILIARRADRDLSGTVWFYVGWLVIFSFASHNLLSEAMTIPLLGFALARAYEIQAIARQRTYQSANSYQIQSLSTKVV